ncbi:hypothetical protein CDIK_3241 [Cucumispora dikerogammari]|nr:hypothetical protein CDIK_3241 [Cucumispora dikerogammari]
MSQENRQTALIMNNATCYLNDSSWTNVDMVFLLKNISSHIQLCDQKIIKLFKDNFLKFITEYIIYDRLSSDNINKIMKKKMIFDKIYITKISTICVSKNTMRSAFQKALNIVSNKKTQLPDVL